MPCVFCMIVEGETRTLLGENEHAIAVLDIYPLVEGHTLVIPKKHYESLAQIPKQELAGLMELLVQIEESMMENLKCQGIDVRQHYRPFLPESKLKVNHVHFHLLPRNNDDDFYHKVAKHEVLLRSEPTKEELMKTAGKINGRA